MRATFFLVHQTDITCYNIHFFIAPIVFVCFFMSNNGWKLKHRTTMRCRSSLQRQKKLNWKQLLIRVKLWKNSPPQRLTKVMNNLFIHAWHFSVTCTKFRIHCWWQSSSRQRISLSPPRQIESFLTGGGRERKELKSLTETQPKATLSIERSLPPLTASMEKSNDDNVYVSPLCSRA